MPPVSCPDIYIKPPVTPPSPINSSCKTPAHTKSLYNFNMSRLRWLLFALFIAVGFGLGLYYGWVLSPVQYVDTTPSSLRADFRTDYTLMVAETFQRDHNIENAAQHLALLGSQSPAQITIEALSYARQNKFDPDDITLLENFNTAMLVGQPGSALPTPQSGGGQP